MGASPQRGNRAGCRQTTWYNDCMPSYVVETPQRCYPILVDRGAFSKLRDHIPPRAGKVFFVSTQDVWHLHGETLLSSVRDLDHEVLIFPGGEGRKRLSEVEALAESMVQKGGDRSSVVVAIGGGIVTDV